MKEHSRNLAVGVTVIVALLMLAGMVLLFTGFPEMFQRGRVIRMNFPDTADVHAGDWIHLRGMRVGKITDIGFVDGDPRKGVQFVGRIDPGVRIPADVVPRVYTRGFVGGAYLALAAGGSQRFDPATGEKLLFLPEDWSEPLEGVREETGMFPKELTEGLRGLTRLAENITELIAPSSPTTTPATGPAATQPATEAGLQGMLAKLGRVLDALDAVLGDAENQANIRKAMGSLAETTAKTSEAMDALKGFAGEATKASRQAATTFAKASEAAEKFATLADRTDGRIEQLTDKFIEDAEKLSAVLTTINRLATKIESGKGTAGQLINDPKLYGSFLEATEQMGLLMKEFRGLIEQWKQHGVPLKIQ